MKKAKYETVSMYCPNCGRHIVGYKQEDGSMRKICDRCKLFLFSKAKNENVMNIKVERISSYSY